MKIKTTKICAHKGCDNIFRLFKTTDKYCSFSCANSNQKAKLKKLQKKEQQIINKFSIKRKRENYLYSKKRKTFMLLHENNICPVAKVIFNEILLVTEIHHKAGRIGKLLNYVPYWLAVSRKGHIWIHANPKEAYELDFLIRSTTIN